MTLTIPKTAAYASGITYPPNLTPALSATLRASGIETLILWAFHIHTNGDIIFNDTTVFTYDATTQTSQYVGDASWPGQLQGLMGTGSTITQMEASIGGWDTGDFANIKTIYDNNNKSFDGTPLESNFRLFKTTLPTVSLIDMDVEETYDRESFVAFCQMLIDLGFAITFCPYTQSHFWTGSLKDLESTGAVKWWNLQCYAGGTGNDPDTWASDITAVLGSSFDTDGYILPSDSSRYFNGQYQVWEGDCVPAFEALMATF